MRQPASFSLIRKNDAGCRGDIRYLHGETLSVHYLIISLIFNNSRGLLGRAEVP